MSTINPAALQFLLDCANADISVAVAAKELRTNHLSKLSFYNGKDYNSVRWEVDTTQGRYYRAQSNDTQSFCNVYDFSGRLIRVKKFRFRETMVYV